MSVLSRLVCYGIKAGREDLIARVPLRVRESFVAVPDLRLFFDPETCLVPVPRSAPLVAPDALWPARMICDALAADGLGLVHRWLRRHRAVRKSSKSPPGERPTVEEHLASMAVDLDLAQPTRITLVDDVVSRGRTLFASAALLTQAFPSIEVRTFAVIRTQSLVPDVATVLDPVIGRIFRTPDGDADREP